MESDPGAGYWYSGGGYTVAQLAGREEALTPGQDDRLRRVRAELVEQQRDRRRGQMPLRELCRPIALELNFDRVAHAAYQVLGARALAVTAESASYPDSHRQLALRVAREFDIPHEVIRTAEMQRPEYRANLKTSEELPRTPNAANVFL